MDRRRQAQWRHDRRDEPDTMKSFFYAVRIEHNMPVSSA
jgi:hypothetical protein